MVFYNSALSLAEKGSEDYYIILTNMASLYYGGTSDVKPNYQKAYEYASTLEAQNVYLDGRDRAFAILARCYYYGHHVLQKYPESKRYALKALATDDTWAREELRVMAEKTEWMRVLRM